MAETFNRIQNSMFLASKWSLVKLLFNLANTVHYNTSEIIHSSCSELRNFELKICKHKQKH